MLVVIGFSALLVVPSYARGFGGGFGGRGGFGGGGFDRGGFGGGGFDHGGYSGGGIERGGYSGGGFDRGGYAGGGFDRGGYAGGGGFNRAGVAGGGVFPRSDYGGGGFGNIAQSRDGARSNLNQFTGHNPSQLSAEGGLGSVAERGNFSGNQFSNQRANIGNTANVGNSFDRNTNVNNFNRTNIAAGNHPYGGYGYHPNAYGYHGYGYHPYGGWGGGLYGYPGGWCSAGFAEATMWTCMGMSTLTDFLGIAAMSSNNSSKQSGPSNVTYEGDNVYVNGQPAQQYYQQSQQLAATAPLNAAAVGSVPLNQQLAYNPASGEQLPNQASNANEKWEPLGVYALVQPGQTDSTTLFQLAINKDGVIRGNYLNQITNEKAQVHGALNKQTQQISWSVGENSDTVFDTNLSELMKEDSKVVVQFGPSNTKQMSLIRQKPPAQNTSFQSSSPNTG